MIMRVVVPVVTALLMLAVGAFWMFTMLLGTNGYDSTTRGRAERRRRWPSLYAAPS